MSLECVTGVTPNQRLTSPIPTTVEEARQVYLGFGKYNGQLITTVPQGYLRWLAGPKAAGMPQRARVAARLLTGG